MMGALMLQGLEYRIGAAELRESGDAVALTGYASTFNEPYDMGWYTESVASGAFARSLGRSPDVRLLVNHAGLPLARTTAGTLDLSEDDHGLRTEAGLDPSDPDVASLVPKMRRGDLNQMSFGFRIPNDGDTWSDDYSQRTLRQIDIHDGDVSIVTYPANPGTVAGLRSGRSVEPIMSALRSMRDDVDPAEMLRRALEFIGRGKIELIEHEVASISIDTGLDTARASASARDRILRTLQRI